MCMNDVWLKFSSFPNESPKCRKVIKTLLSQNCEWKAGRKSVRLYAPLSGNYQRICNSMFRKDMRHINGHSLSSSGTKCIYKLNDSQINFLISDSK